jgi:LAO/AO transport system kinase
MSAAEDLVARLRAGELAALARAITAVENETAEAPGILRAIQPHLGHARVHGFTGPPGVGKSTLVDAYITELRKRNLRVGVIAVDPSSPVSGGAILGDPRSPRAAIWAGSPPPPPSWSTSWTRPARTRS